MKAMPAPHRPAISKLQLFSLLALALVITFAREPGKLIQGAVFGEEGTTYLRFAWNAAPLRALLAPHLGYYSLLDNAVTLIAARVLPLAAASCIFVWAAVGVRLLAAYLIVTCEFLPDLGSRVLTLLAFLLATGSLEGWLSLEYCQFSLPISVALILISTESRWRTPASRVFTALVLVLAGLTGVTSCALLPLFWVKAVRSRTRSALTEAGVLSLATAIQFGYVAACVHSGDKHTSGFNPRYLGAVLLQRVVLLPFFTSRIVADTNQLFAAHPASLLPLAWLVLLLAVFLAFRLARPGAEAAACLLAAATLSAGVNSLGCPGCSDPRLFMDNPVAASRYYYSADAMIAIALGLLFALSTTKRRRLISGALLGLALLGGALQYPRGVGWLDTPPAPWRPQVAIWRRDQTTPLYIAPGAWGDPVVLPHRHQDLSIPIWIYEPGRTVKLNALCAACRSQTGNDSACLHVCPSPAARVR